MKKINQKGITLIALIITIIVLLILAGIIISLTIGERSVVNHAEQAGIKSKEASAREELELALLDLQAEKATNPEYNENEYIDNYLSNEQMVVMGDIVLVDGWQFRIDRSVPKIAIALGKGQESKEINLVATVENATDYTKSKIKIEVAYEGEITSIQINGEELIIPEKVDGKYVLEKEILQNGNYTVYVKDAKDSYKIANVKITEISEDMVIRTVEDLVAFRDKVNKGATYVERTITLENDLDLSSVCGQTIGSWKPIGDYSTNTSYVFSGTFNGNNHTIDNLYINSSNDYQGLFGYVQNGTIKGIVNGSNSDVIGNNNVGGIAGFIDNALISDCGNNSSVIGKKCVAGIVGSSKDSQIISTYNKGDISSKEKVAGIVGRAIDNKTANEIKYSYNTGNITVKQLGAGGIQGTASTHSRIYNCYNSGNIINHDEPSVTSPSQEGYVAGIAGRLTIDGKISYCYNLGNITNESTGYYVGGISGLHDTNASTISNSYNVGHITSKGKITGGIVGDNQESCKLNNCYILDTVQVKYNTTLATSNIGASSNYLGKCIGRAYSTNTTYISGIGTLTEDKMPTVYHVVNGLNSGESQYWSNSDLNKPKLLWEK